MVTEFCETLLPGQLSGRAGGGLEMAGSVFAVMLSR